MRAPQEKARAHFDAAGVDRVIFVAVRHPEYAGGSTYLSTMTEGLLRIGIPTETLAVFAGNRRSAEPVQCMHRNEKLHRQSIRSLTHSRALQAALFARRGIERVAHRKAIHRFFSTTNQRTLTVVTHPLAIALLDSYGAWPQSLPGLKVGQHHSSWHSLDLEPGLKVLFTDMYANVDGLTTLSADDITHLRPLLPSTHMCAIDNPLSPSIAARMQPPESLAENFSGRALRAIAMCRLAPEKAVPSMVHLFSQTQQAISPESGWNLDIFGNGSDRPHVVDAIRSAGASDRVHLRGWADDPAREFAQSRLHLMTSVYEGFGLTILESAACGVPSIAFGVSGGVTRVLNATGGILIPPQSGAQYVTALNQFFDDPNAQRERAAAARHGAEQFLVESVLERFAEFVRAIRAGA